MELQKFMEMACEGARSVGEDFRDPQDDWLPLLLIETEQGILVLCELNWRSQEEKQVCGQMVIPQLVRAERAVNVALVTSAWMRYVPKELAKSEAILNIPPSRAPDRMEVVCIHAFARNGKALAANALIYRDGVHPPYLGEWETLTPENLGGEMVAPIVRALAGLSDGKEG